MVLADTSVWIDHLRRGNPQLSRLIAQERIVLHPFVIGELALGLVAHRAEVLNDLHTIETARLAEHHEVLTLIERTPLWGRGIGWVDAHLLASVLLDRLRLWTLDQKLAAVAGSLGVQL